MKCLIVVIFALVAFAAADVNEDIHKKHHEICIKDHPLTKEQWDKMQDYDFPDEKQVHEYILCHFKQMDFFSEETGFKTDNILEYFVKTRIDTEKARTGVATCLNSSQDDKTLPAAERAYRGFICMINKRKADKE